MKRLLLSLLIPALAWGQSVTLDSEWVGASSTELTIATGAVTATGTVHTLDTEADAASDDLDTITQASSSYTYIIVTSTADARNVVLKNGTGNINLNGNTDVTLDTALDDWVMLRYESAAWHEVFRSPSLTLEPLDSVANLESRLGVQVAAGDGTVNGDIWVWDHDVGDWEIHAMSGDATINKDGAITLTNPVSVLDPNADVPLYYNDTNERIESARGVINYSETFTILEPDAVQGVSDDIVLKKWIAEAYPSGVTITSIHIDASAAYTSETFLFEHWDDASGTTQATVESITASAISTEDDGTLSDATIPADYFLVVNLDDTPEDKAYVAITISYTID